MAEEFLNYEEDENDVISPHQTTNGEGQDNDNKNKLPLYKRLLIKWKFNEKTNKNNDNYINVFENEGYDDIQDWMHLNDDELINHLKMRPGHIKQFKRNIKQYFEKKQKQKQKYHDEKEEEKENKDNHDEIALQFGEAKSGFYLSGYFSGKRIAYDNLKTAMQQCIIQKAPGITFCGNAYELRASNYLQISPSNEISWIYLPNQQNEAQLFSEENKGCYLGGYKNNTRLYYSTLKEAMHKCIEYNCGGITYVPSENVYELRASNSLSISPSQEISWIYKLQSKEENKIQNLFSHGWNGYYLSGYPNNQRIAFSNLEKAMEKCVELKAGGVTFVPDVKEYEIRASKNPAISPSNEISWVYNS